MKKRNILKLGVFVVALFVGVFNASARTIYTSYEAGDKITVNVNDSTKLDFYVVEDSSSESSTVEAIMDGTSYPTKTTYANLNSTLSSYTSSWTNVTNVSIPSMYKLIGIDASTLTESDKFTSPTYAITVASYWLSDSGQISDVVGHWVLGSTLSDEGTYGVYSDTQEIAIRPLINVAKEKVVGGATTSEIDDLNVSFKFEEDKANTYRSVYLSLDSSKFRDNDYRALLSKTNSNLPETYSDDTNLVYMSKNINNTSNYTIHGVDYFKYASMYGNVYLTIYEYDGTNFVKTSTPKLVKRLDYLPYSYRIVGQFYDDKSAGFKFNDIHFEEQTIKFKIGEITDKSLLSKFSNPTQESYEALLKFAQEDTNPNQSSSIKINQTQVGDTYGDYPNVYDPTKVVDGKYYYVYFEVDTEDGKYQVLNDVALYLAQEDGNLWASNYKDEVVENPKTGSASGIIGIVAITALLIGSVAYIKMKKYSKFPQA